MFDRLHIHAGDQRHYHDTTIKEFRAPTDESVRLLKEMEAEAEKKILGSVRIQNSQIDCVVHSRKNVLRLDIDFIVQLKINGKDIKVEHKVSEFTARDEVAHGLMDLVGKRIAAELLGPAFSWAKWKELGL
ncbi:MULTISPECIES: hypothetical protein [Delftia]|uniref:hypothetical protein n=1 Tax=Delftia TaxID=80865 RepID=UPI000F827532|nr:MULTISPECIES: hypothetical protein [Delftia]WEM00084.1 hypothetical protein PW274_07300 [Delftia tsuruhatensis]